MRRLTGSQTIRLFAGIDTVAFNQRLKISEIYADAAGDGASEARSKLEINRGAVPCNWRKRDGSSGEMLAIAPVRHGPPGDPPFRDAHDDFQDRFLLMPRKAQANGELISVDSSRTLDGSDELWVFLDCQPAGVNVGHWRIHHD